MNNVIVGPNGTNVPFQGCVVTTDYMQGWNRKLIDLTHLTFCQWQAVSAYLQGTSTADVLVRTTNTDALHSVALAADEIGLVQLRNATHLEIMIREKILQRDHLPPTCIPMLSSPGFQMEMQLYGGFRVTTLFVTGESTIRPTEYSYHYPLNAVIITGALGVGVVVFCENAPIGADLCPSKAVVCATLNLNFVGEGETFFVQQL
tara:strand:- start:2212 stop:2823 length:612 start_codon:yes stop_codon:yes gene_type:complete